MTIPVYSDPCHMPCPDLPHHSLSKEDKERGLEKLQQVRAQVREGMLSSLRKEYEQAESSYQRALINQRAKRIKRNWS
ncbi:hypothetical protein TW78_04460 [Vibrio coralliilyticus]|uniref:Uncharacterized protein n=1 Tax=Vibrio coralliilyticus TaxID=190893 RepID=A0A7Y4BK78_9VIBR|nr:MULTISPECIES: hypothetical protein [Vibrio]AIW21130.1 hypothetical protein IX92_19045 [Vibrio coralliilyticus]KJY76682.1 hypothetical protein TW78_04460 [Vibrio coralliilyticus]MCG9681236.1 hypothetical protein [Vibrio sp. Isolate23]MCM5509781.1 hypothetical protein [Vibrio sp. SCSIO 43169]NOH39338.1 hypothetical protein [Vibrio coralliilyticus]